MNIMTMRQNEGKLMNYLDYRNKTRIEEIDVFKESTKSRQLNEYVAVEEEWVWTEIMRLREVEKQLQKIVEIGKSEIYNDIQKYARMYIVAVDCLNGN